jgi:glycosyltransferase involved in cell wall biosynthesis
MNRQVSVIIATAARPERAAALRRAIDGVCGQQPAPELIVVVNGSTFDPALVQALQGDPRLRYAYQTVGSYPAAQRRGRELVRTQFFCFLDDDDELLEGSLACRLQRMQQPDAPDVVICDGVRRAVAGDVAFCEHQPGAGDDLMLDLLRENWFASSAPLFRSATVELDFFDGHTKYYEWTMLAFRLLIARRRFAFVAERGFRLHDSPGSLSKSPAGVRFTPELLNQLLELGPPPAVRVRLRRRLAAAHHACADLERAEGHPCAAWRHHLRSLIMPGGLNYLSYTRHLLRPPKTQRRV